jgi:hypothetical protein
MSKLREAERADEDRILWVITHLKQARMLLKKIGAKKTLAKVHSALKSAEGAERHINRSLNEWERRRKAS